MEPAHLKLGEFAKGTINYTGFHRDLEPVFMEGVFGVALGDRSTKPCYGESEIEERDSHPNIRRIR